MWDSETFLSHFYIFCFLNLRPHQERRRNLHGKLRRAHQWTLVRIYLKLDLSPMMWVFGGGIGGDFWDCISLCSFCVTGRGGRLKKFAKNWANIVVRLLAKQKKKFLLLLEIMEGPEIFILGTCPLWGTSPEKKEKSGNYNPYASQ